MTADDGGAMDDGQLSGEGRPRGEDPASTGWVAGSIVSLLIGWSLALASILSTSGPSSSQWPDGGRVLLAVIAVAMGIGVPALGLLRVRRQERLGRPTSDAVPAVCAVVMLLGVCTLLPMLVLQVAQVLS
ncbi:hypothetical protein QUG98_08685 [Curtobacterium sp. RHCJP20]|uniref:DUF4190 domain-containing protein n=1 Tax=Curtobacterium subtropicum TaxID=3055138 RepID=A0ABT7TG15_9MICO|nr:hypothetical protein [Curtobacterium subtropicum]MDM7888531.1 hypothetical protein [Curtobacterium subtropicum]